MFRPHCIARSHNKSQSTGSSRQGSRIQSFLKRMTMEAIAVSGNQRRVNKDPPEETTQPWAAEDLQRLRRSQHKCTATWNLMHGWPATIFKCLSNWCKHWQSLKTTKYGKRKRNKQNETTMKQLKPWIPSPKPDKGECHRTPHLRPLKLGHLSL